MISRERTTSDRVVAFLVYVPVALLVFVVAKGRTEFIVPLVLFVVSVAAYWREGRAVWTYTDADEKTPAPTEYLAEARNAADRLGFRPVVTFRNVRDPLIKVRYEFRVSADLRILMIAGAGTMALMPVECVWVYSRLEDGTLLLTLNNQLGYEYDLSGLADVAVYPKIGVADLVARHSKRLSEAKRKALSYSERSIVSEHREALRQRVARLAEMGYAAPKDEAWQRWRYTIPGAIQIAVRNYSHGLFAAVRSMIVKR